MSKKYSLLDSEMKEWEHKYRRVIDPSEYVILRIDGRAFHTFTRGLDKPFDRANKVSGGAACSRLQPGGSERPLSEPGQPTKRQTV